jgi:hypothetical protein
VDRSKEASARFPFREFVVNDHQWQWERTYLAPHNPAMTTGLVSPPSTLFAPLPCSPEVQGRGAIPQ